MARWVLVAVLGCTLSIAFGGVSSSAVDTSRPQMPPRDRETSRRGKFFPFYTIGRIANVPCTGNAGLTGTCLIRGECTANAGVPSGNCSTLTNQATCCVYTQSCGGSTNFNSTYFTNPGYPAAYNQGGTCTFIVNPCSADVCQLRIDFRALTLLQPDGDGFCQSDRLTVTGGTVALPVLCGENTGQHVYVNFAGTAPITITITTNGAISLNRLWNLELSQIACASRQRAPAGCLQYYLEPTGEISSFNYGTGANPALNSVLLPGTRQLANTNYGICIRPGAGMCTITYQLPAADPYAFTVTGDANVVDPTLAGNGAVGLNGIDCTTDFIFIPNPTVADPNAAGIVFMDRFCGLGLYAVTSNVRPFVVYVVTDGNETPDVANRGFRLVYSQAGCTAA